MYRARSRQVACFVLLRRLSMIFRTRVAVYAVCVSIIWLCFQIWLWTPIKPLELEFSPSRRYVTLIGAFDWAGVVTREEGRPQNAVYETRFAIAWGGFA